MASPGFSGTRLITRATGDVLSVRCARLQVIVGPDKGKTLELGERASAIIGTSSGADLQLRDDSVSSKHAEVSADANGYIVRDMGSTNGLRVAGVRVREAIIGSQPQVISLGKTDIRLTVLSDEIEHELSTESQFGSVLGAAPVMRKIFATLHSAAASDSTILLQGESGTGKELIAENIHRRSARKAGPFVVVDCGGIAESLLESEFFGHEKGAFTGAAEKRVGLFTQAHGGTLFLDETANDEPRSSPRVSRRSCRCGASLP